VYFVFAFVWPTTKLAIEYLRLAVRPERVSEYLYLYLRERVESESQHKQLFGWGWADIDNSRVKSMSLVIICKVCFLK